MVETLLAREVTKQMKRADQAEARVKELEDAIKADLDGSGCQHPKCLDSVGGPIIGCAESRICRVYHSKAESVSIAETKESLPL